MTRPTDRDELPDDPATLQGMIRELLAALADTRREADSLRVRLDQLLRRLYGPKSEKGVRHSVAVRRPTQ